jgi:uncharacterized membrane protein YdjX (TVP38/TMEM64 family)
MMKLLRDHRLWAAAAVLVLLLALRASGFGDVLTLEALARHRASLAELVGRNALQAGAVYVSAYVAVVALSLPGAAVMTLAGGLLFGAVAGTVLSVTGATIGATLVFLLARRILGEDALSRLGPRSEAIAAGIRREAVSYLLVLRLVPLFPFVLVNLVPALVGVRLAVFVGTTVAGIIPGTAVFSTAGAGLGDVLAAGGSFEIGRVLTPAVLGALLGAAALSLAAIPLRRRFAAPQEKS